MDVIIFQDPAAETEKQSWTIKILKCEHSISIAYLFPKIKP